MPQGSSAVRPTNGLYLYLYLSANFSVDSYLRSIGSIIWDGFGAVLKLCNSKMLIT